MEAYNFEVENSRLLKNIFDRYELQSIDREDLVYIFEGAFGDLILNSECKDRYSNCKIGSYALYALEVSGCAATGASTIWMGGAGVLLGSACTAVATVHLDSMLTECKYKYEDCLKGK